jgi:hypothetical protein
MRRKWFIIPLLAASFWVLAGCSRGDRPVARVSGVVTYNGKPLTTGTVMFVPIESGPPAYGKIEPDGRYKLSTYSSGDGAVIGKHAVMITALEQLTPEEAANPLRSPKLLIPMKYNDTKTSGLTAEVTSDDNMIDFPLK